jgi:hypothetical protein
MTADWAAVGQRVAERCRQVLRLDRAELSEEYWYAHLPLCVIDAVCSSDVSYQSTRAAVRRV